MEHDRIAYHKKRLHDMRNCYKEDLAVARSPGGSTLSEMGSARRSDNDIGSRRQLPFQEDERRISEMKEEVTPRE